MSHPSPPFKTTYVNPGSVIGTSVTFIILGTAVVSGRFVVRRVKRSFVGLDDWFALAALFFAVLYCTTHIIAVVIHTEGYHSPPAPHGLQSTVTALPPIQVRFKKIEYILNFTFVLFIGSVRLSTLFFYRRIFLGRGFKIAWGIIVVATTLWTIIFFFTSVFQCGSNFSAYWGSFANNVKPCFDIAAAIVALSITDVALDIAVLVLPLPYVWRLQMPKKQKLGVSFVFLLGLFSVAAGATRLAMNINVNFLHRIVGFTLFWQLVQVGVALFASNLITLRPLFPYLWPAGLLSNLHIQLFSSHSSNTHVRREEADQKSDDYTPFNGSAQGLLKPGAAEQYLTAMPLHTLGKKGNQIHVKPGQIRVQNDIVSTVAPM